MTARVSYPPTDFSTLASAVELGPVTSASALQFSATRTALAAVTGMVTGTSRYLTEAGRDGLFVFDASNLSAKITADPNQGVYVAPASAPTGASGAWVRKFSGAPAVWLCSSALGRFHRSSPAWLATGVLAANA